MAKCRTGTGKLWSDVKVGKRSKRASEMRQACDRRAGWGWVLVCSYPWVAADMQLTSASPAKACAVPRYKFLENWSSKMIFAMLPVKVSSQSFSPVSVAMWVVLEGWPAEGLVGVSGAFNFRTDLQLGLSEAGSRTWRGWPHQSHHSRPTTTCAGQWLLLPCTQTRSPKLPVPLLVLPRCA